MARGRRSTAGNSSAQTSSAGVASTPTDTAQQAFWTARDEERFIAFMVDHKSEAGDGGSFKIKTFRAAADHLNQYLTQGAPKKGTTCKTKFSRYVRSGMSFL